MKIVGIEYAGIGSEPFFIVQNEQGDIKFVTVERGITKLNKELVGYISSYFEVGSREALSYIHIMNKKELTQTLKKMGLEDKEIKPLFK